jgi:hypothetical protein
LRRTIRYAYRRLPNKTAVEPGATTGIWLTIWIGLPANVKPVFCRVQRERMRLERVPRLTERRPVRWLWIEPL